LCKPLIAGVGFTCSFLFTAIEKCIGIMFAYVLIQKFNIMTKIEFNTLVIRQAIPLRSYALHFTHNADDANDLVQDTILKAITYYNKFKEGTNLKGWLYTIMRNTFINNYRRFIKMNTFVTKY